jgi:hypothetical protein
MAQVICISKHGQFQQQLGGVRFFSSDVGRISEEIDDEQVAEFLKTPAHFRLHAGEPIEEAKKAPKPPKEKAPKGGAGSNAGGAGAGQQTQQPGF